MSITKETELMGMKKVSEAVARTLKEMRAYATPGMTAKELDDWGGQLLKKLGAKSAPKLSYGFPGWTCISINHEIAHGVPHARKVLKEGDLINIDVSAELGGYWSDNGGSFVLGKDLHGHQPLVEASRQILKTAISSITAGGFIAELGRHIQGEARKRGYTVIRNLAGHGIGRSLHEAPHEILNCYDQHNHKRFSKGAVVAIETFISTASTFADTGKDGWTLLGNKGGFVAQHEHTLLVTEEEPLVLTSQNGIWD